jgi:hypothetical protein
LGGTTWLLTGAGRLGEFGDCATVQVVFLDGETGQILWADRFRDDFVGTGLDHLASYVFQTFPIGAPKPGHYHSPKLTF